MKKKSGLFAGLLVSALAIGALASCGEEKVNPEDLVKQILITNDGAKVSADFKLPSHVVNNKVNYKIDWKSDDEKHLRFDYSVDDPATPEDESLDDVKARITRSEEKLIPVTFHGEVTVDGKTAKTDDFSVRILKQISAREEFENTYNNATQKLNVTLSGYILAKAGYMTYNNKDEVALYIYDEVAQGAYYIYNSEMTEEDYNALEVGDYVTATNVQSTVYNGVTEFQYGKTAKDTSKEKKTDLPVLDITSDAINNEVSTYDQSQIVTLKGAKVKSISKDAVPSTAGKYLSTMHTVLEVELNGNSYNLVLTQGVSPFTNEATTTLCTTLRDKVKVNDLVDIKGVLFGSSDIVALDENAVTKVTESTANTVIAAANNVSVSKTFFAGAEEMDLTATVDDCAVTYTVDENSYCEVANGKLVVKNFTGSGKVMLVANVTKDGVTAKKTIRLVFSTKTAQEMVTEAKTRLATKYEGSFKDFELGVEDTEYPGVTLSYALPQNEKNATVKNNVLSLKGFAAATTTLTVTLTCGDVTETVEIPVTITKATPVGVENVISAEKNDLAYVNGTVLAVGTRGYILADSTDMVYVYTYGNNKSKPAFKVGDVVGVYGKKDYYNGDELIPVYETKLEGEAMAAPEAQVFDKDAIAQFLAGKSFDVKKVKVTAKLSVSSSYYNLVVEGLDGQGSLSYPNAEIEKLIKGYAGKNVVVEGYTFGISTKKVDNVTKNYFCNILATSIELFPLTATEALEEVKTEVSKLGKEINADLALPATVAVAGYTGNISITYKYKNTEAAITNVEYVASEEAVKKTVVATITVGDLEAYAQEFEVTLAADTVTKLATFTPPAASQAVPISAANNNSSYTDGSYTLTFTNTSYGYVETKDGVNTFRIGTSKLAGSAKFETPDDVDYVVLYLKLWSNDTCNLTINGTSYTDIPDSAWTKVVIDVKTSHEVTIVIAAKCNRIQIQKIEFSKDKTAA